MVHFNIIHWSEMMNHIYVVYLSAKYESQHRTLDSKLNRQL